VGPRACVDIMGEWKTSCLCGEFDPIPSSLLPGLCTDFAIVVALVLNK
jgi:hypothetical protein